MINEELTVLKTASIKRIARIIISDWGRPSPYAKPYIEAMLTMDKITDPYYLDPGREIVARFLCNARIWKGDVARVVKKELNARLKQTI